MNNRSPGGLARLSYPDRTRFFNTAAVGIESEDARQEAARHHELGWNHAVDDVVGRFAALVEGRKQFVTIFHNTTAAVQRVFLRLSQLLGTSSPTLLTTDMEYPGIISLVDEAWPGRLVMARVEHLLWQGRASEINAALKRSLMLTKPGVFYVSHVSRTSGYLLDMDILKFARAVNPRIVIIIDGAQAIGNIAVDQDLLSLADFYVTSGHKWLGGRPTLGLVYADEKWRIRDPAQSYSMRLGSGGTGNRQALISLGVGLRDFIGAPSAAGFTSRIAEIAATNAALSIQFSHEIIEKLSWTCLPAKNVDGWRWNGIVAVPDVPLEIANLVYAQLKFSGGREAITLVEEEPWREPLGGDSPGPRFTLDITETGRFEPVDSMTTLPNSVPACGCLRFCFHYYHSVDDIRNLVDRLVSIVIGSGGSLRDRRASRTIVDVARR